MKQQFMAGIKIVLGEFVPERRLSHISEETLLRDLGIDSIDMVQFVTHLEKTFQISLSDDDLMPENFRNIASMIHMLERKKGEIGTDDTVLSS